MKLEVGDRIWISKADGATHTTETGLWVEWDGYAWLGCKLIGDRRFRWKRSLLARYIGWSQNGDVDWDNATCIVEQLIAEGAM